MLRIFDYESWQPVQGREWIGPPRDTKEFDHVGMFEKLRMDQGMELRQHTLHCPSILRQWFPILVEGDSGCLIDYISWPWWCRSACCHDEAIQIGGNFDCFGTLWKPSIDDTGISIFAPRQL